MRPDICSEILLESVHPHVDHRTGHNRTRKTTRREDQNAAIDRGDLSGLGNFPHNVLPCVVLAVLTACVAAVAIMVATLVVLVLAAIVGAMVTCGARVGSREGAAAVYRLPTRVPKPRSSLELVHAFGQRSRNSSVDQL